LDNTDENEIFGAEMLDVKPLQTSNKAKLAKTNSTDASLQERRVAATVLAGEDENYLSSEFTHALKASDMIDFKRPGMQHGVLKKFRLGYYTIEATLGLHQMQVDQARKEVFEFIQECTGYGLRTVLITHGKGTRSVDKVAVLKSCVAQWLPQIPNVLAVHSAQPHHGGSGSVYIMLKKSAKDKLANREKNAKGKR
jgi:DNA-nicking Smr family endonuclease